MTVFLPDGSVLGAPAATTPAVELAAARGQALTVVTDAGENWNVAPGLLSKVTPASARKNGPDDEGIAQFPNRTAEK